MLATAHTHLSSKEKIILIDPAVQLQIQPASVIRVIVIVILVANFVNFVSTPNCNFQTEV